MFLSANEKGQKEEVAVVSKSQKDYKEKGKKWIDGGRGDWI
jgi:hypothetical protein